MSSPPLLDADATPLDETVYPRRRPASRRAHAPAAASPPGAGVGPTTQRMAGAEGTDATVAPRRIAVRGEPVRGDLLLYLGLAALVAAAWQTSRLQWIRPDGDTGYWLGVAGGSCMLALFVYPMRKYLRWMQGWGKVKAWFWAHLALGIAGPWLILVHSRFTIGSLNAGVALVSMGIVVCSGVIGRFIYVRIHRGLDGERTSLHALHQRAGLVEDTARSRLHFCPVVEARLLAFEQHELHARSNWHTHLRQATLLPLQRWLTYLQCVRMLRAPLHALAAQHRWSGAQLQRRRRRARRLVDQYLHAVVRVAQFSAYERVFALWHLAHLPFIYLLVISAVVHVFAVHAY